MKRTRRPTPADRVANLWDLHCLAAHGVQVTDWCRRHPDNLGGCSDCRVFDHSFSEALAYPSRYPAVRA